MVQNDAAKVPPRSTFEVSCPQQDQEMVDHEESEARRSKCSSSKCGGFACGPCGWLAMLGRNLEFNFLFGAIVVYGMSQGVGGGLQRVIVEYYWKDVQLAQPAAVQLYHIIVTIPWDMKPVWGLLTDLVPIAGYHRRPYFMLAGALGIISSAGLVLGGNLHVIAALLLLIAGSASACIAEVTIDAVVAKKSRDHPQLASDIQSLCAMSLSIGRFVGFSVSGVAVKTFGPQEAMGVLLIQPIFFIILGIVLREPRLLRSFERRSGKMRAAVIQMWSTFRCPLVWKPVLYTFLSWALCPDITDGLFFFYTNPTLGLSFSQGYMGAILALASLASFAGVVIYQKTLKGLTFRSLLFWAQLLLALSGTFDLVLVTGFNVRLGIPGSILAAVDESVGQALIRMKWIPIFVLCARLCPPGIEGFFFALLLSIDLLGLRVSTWGGSVMLNVMGVTRTNFQYLWLAVLTRNALRLLPLTVLFLVPNLRADGDILPSEFQGSPKATKLSVEIDEEHIQLVQVEQRDQTESYNDEESGKLKIHEALIAMEEGEEVK
ncbi:hypothetical protein O6H91_10G099300 [Diphasiastrum complanatum]|uniref:Uncharacterized protein n=1 Tax=Diphasiastrum complanatum TaxID=34168 RepID=A0ACC2CJW4_DIPCM|nr:hypothetical protein O6H91_10G099300 [Diphasiastrum complanatum]